MEFLKKLFKGIFEGLKYSVMLCGLVVLVVWLYGMNTVDSYKWFSIDYLLKVAFNTIKIGTPIMTVLSLLAAFSKDE